MSGIRQHGNEGKNYKIPLKLHCLGKFATKAIKYNHRVVFYPFVFILCHYVTILFDIYRIV